jgi:hypothetical protein
VNRPISRRLAISCVSVVDAAASALAIDSRNALPTMTRRSPTRSANRPTAGATSAMAMVGAVTVNPTAKVDA